MDSSSRKASNPQKTPTPRKSTSPRKTPTPRKVIANPDPKAQAAMMRIIFKPVKASLERIKEATEDRIPAPKERARVMRGGLVTIGNFIASLIQEEKEEGLCEPLWEYVARFWPLDPTPNGSQLEKMYYKILLAEKPASQSDDAPATANPGTI